MIIVRIEHPVPEFAAWKRAFDGDPVGRQRSGVRRYRILRPIDKPNFVMVDLEFATSNEAEAFLQAMRSIWRQVQGSLIGGPRAEIVEVLESKEY